MLEQRRRLLVVRRQPALQRLLGVVLALLEGLARLVVEHALVFGKRLGRRELGVVRAARRGVDPPAADPLGEHPVRHLQGDDEADGLLRLAELPVEELGLLHRPREAVEDEPLLAVRLRDPLGDGVGDDLIGHEPSCSHDCLRLHADRRAGLDGGAEHVPRREGGDAQRRGDGGGLRAFAGAGRAEEEEDAAGAGGGEEQLADAEDGVVRLLLDRGGDRAADLALDEGARLAEVGLGIHKEAEVGD
mmetsp:Transcript_3768/g.9111  ORF Transcript_3768/g.9111 Transcript_3768/m.9111 type:complete len:246 (-) Transcript_3768:491-1228(-)